MIPWPLTLFIMGYAVLGTALAADAWRALPLRPAQAALPLAWCAAFMTLALGLSFLRPWARRMAVGVSWFLMLATLGSALVAVLHVPPQPRAAVWGTMIAALQVLAVRYLTRPHVRRWFAQTVIGDVHR